MRFRLRGWTFRAFVHNAAMKRGIALLVCSLLLIAIGASGDALAKKSGKNGKLLQRTLYDYASTVHWSDFATASPDGLNESERSPAVRQIIRDAAAHSETRDALWSSLAIRPRGPATSATYAWGPA